MDRGRLELFQVPGHAGAVQLEGALGLTARKHGERLLVIKRNVLDVDDDVAGRSYARDGVGEYGEVLDAKEVELKESRVFYGMHVVLSNELAGLGVDLNRSPVRERSR